MYHGLTLDTYKGALKTANREFDRACRLDNKGDITRWKIERDRILAIVCNWDLIKESTDG